MLTADDFEMDGLPYESAGAKAGPSGDEYQKKTQNQEPFMAENMDKEEMLDDDEALLDDSDDSERAAGANYPTAQGPMSDPAVASSLIGVHSQIADPEPDVKGLSATDEAEGEEEGEEEEEEEEEGETFDAFPDPDKE